MNDSLVHQLLVSTQNLFHDQNSDILGDEFLGLYHGLQISKRAVFHHQIVCARFFNYIIAFDDVWML